MISDHACGSLSSGSDCTTRSLIFSRPSSCNRRIAAAVNGLLIDPMLKRVCSLHPDLWARLAKPYPWRKMTFPAVANVTVPLKPSLVE